MDMAIPKIKHLLFPFIYIDEIVQHYLKASMPLIKNTFKIAEVLK